jgi:ubiquinone/menaquinone biosynthesis C-methylase UbiE
VVSGEDLIKKIKKHVHATFDDISDEFDETRYKPWPETIEFLKNMTGGSQVLDLGCGNGRNSVYATQNNLPVIGVDISGSMVSIARSKYKELAAKSPLMDAQFIRSDLEALPFSDNSMDAAVCVATLHHIPSGAARSKAASELRRVLKPGGSAFISVWDLDQPKFKEELMRQVYGVCMARSKNGEDKKACCGNIKHPPPYEFGDVWVPWKAKNGKVYHRFYHLFYHNELVELLESSGFKVINYFKRMDNHNAIVIKE